MKNEVKKGNTNGNVNVNLDKGDSLGQNTNRIINSTLLPKYDQKDNYLDKSNSSKSSPNLVSLKADKTLTMDEKINKKY